MNTSASGRGQATYRVDLAPAARKSLDKLRGEILSRLRIAIEGLAENPRPRGCRKLAGVKDTYRLRVGDYRVIYFVDDTAKLVVITKVARRTTTTY